MDIAATLYVPAERSDTDRQDKVDLYRNDKPDFVIQLYPIYIPRLVGTLHTTNDWLFGERKKVLCIAANAIKTLDGTST